MYIEFVIGYILLGVVATLLVAVIVLLCIILKKISRLGTRPLEIAYSPYSKSNVYSSDCGIAICRNCAAQFDAAHRVCPKCGVPR